jgi:hypothetical protein
MNKIRMLVTMLSVFGCVLFGSSVASAQIRTVLVSPVPGDPIASGTALLNKLAGISSPSSTNRWLLKIEPGIYEVQPHSLAMRPWVDIEGSGMGLTTIIANTAFGPTIRGASNAELRMLTVEGFAPQVSFGPTLVAAMSNDNAHPRVYRVKFVVNSVNSDAWGMRNLSSAPKIEECEFNISIIPSILGQSVRAHGVSFIGFIPTGERSSIVRSRIVVSGGLTNYGVTMTEGQTVSEIQETRIDTFGSVNSTYGIYAFGGNWQGAEMLGLRNVFINSPGGGVRGVGIWLEANTTVGLDIYNSKVWGHVAPTTQGIFQGGNMPIGLRFSSVVGYTKTVETVQNASIGYTDLIGGPVIRAPNSWIGCMAISDEMGIFYPNSCPP